LEYADQFALGLVHEGSSLKLDVERKVMRPLLDAGVHLSNGAKEMTND
jgi:hypothetical protein